jgi:hypothetical protein
VAGGNPHLKNRTLSPIVKTFIDHVRFYVGAVAWTRAEIGIFQAAE